MARISVAFATVIALWAIGAAVVAGGALVDLRERARGPEAPLRAYLAAVTAEDLDAALQTIAPAARPRAAPFIAEQLGNSYRILGLGVRHPSLLARLLGRADSMEQALITVQLDITLTTGETWRATTHVPVVWEAGAWYLARAPLQPEPP
ncbi:MAG TPA: hypothetical protein VFB73_03030 [Chloroflexota bacterium]|nr:hypothetical protein [Chloroflexota bacterium]HZU04921.1 hypothetical protein [Chloroflexota bacterium]